MTLFSEMARTDSRPLRHPETHYAFYDRVAGPFWDAVRGLLEDWFSRLSASSQADLRARLQDKDRRKFDGAFWELYLHELFRRLGFAVHHQPTILRDGKSPGAPDLLLERDGDRIYIEAMIVADSNAEDHEERLRNNLVDAINARVKSSGFYVALEILHEGTANLPVAEIARGLQAWLDRWNPDVVSALQYGYRVFDHPAWTWNNNGWRLRFVAMPKPSEIRGRPGDRVIALGPSGSKITDAFSDGRIMRERLNDKANKYQGLGVPYIVALLVRRSFCDERDVQKALFGGIGIDAELLRYGRIDPVQAGDWDGVWATRAGPKHRNVSAVLWVRGLEPAKVAEVAPTLWHCPWAERPVTSSLPLASVRIESSGTSLRHEQAIQSPGDIFGLSTPWPPGKPFPDSSAH
jgi:hypothetical protein